METYYFSSIENKIFSKAIKCEYIKKINLENGQDAVIAELDEAVLVKNGNETFYTNKIIIVSRAGLHHSKIFDIYNIEDFPTFVHIGALKNQDYDSVEIINGNDFVFISSGQLYKTREDANSHKIPLPKYKITEKTDKKEAAKEIFRKIMFILMFLILDIAAFIAITYLISKENINGQFLRKFRMAIIGIIAYSPVLISFFCEYFFLIQEIIPNFFTIKSDRKFIKNIKKYYLKKE